MPLQLSGQIGQQAASDGGIIPFRQGRSGEQIMSELHGRYYETAFRGNVFYASVSAQTSSAGLAATYTGGVCVSNPIGSGKNLSILKVSAGLVVVTAAATAIGLIVGSATTGLTAHTTPLVPGSTVIGGSVVPVAKADQACTLVGTPVWFNPVLAVTASAAALVAVPPLDVEGKLIIAPGGYVALGTNIASPALGFSGAISWEEVAV